MRFEWTVLMEPGEEGWWIAEIPQVPGAISQGRTPEEARENVLDAANLVLEALRDDALKARPKAQSQTLVLTA